ncbi:unnamed protein product [Enterobius vermicularis]|uniref:Sulfurtransferase n=1 Tax=Enterobius vermicularis TaxID=51028 RepID=A0A158QAF3_ENTVE|nr:unnamed protein product [Enterobius vermicularis]
MNPVVSVTEVEQLLKEKNVKLIDATYTLRPDFPDWKTFHDNYYGDFKKLIDAFPEKAYEEEHIENAVNFSLDIGLFIAKYKRYDLYPAEIFEEYARILGINNGDHLIIYGRGIGAGMLFSAHVWFALKYYGVENVQLLDGGIESWKKSGKSIVLLDCRPSDQFSKPAAELFKKEGIKGCHVKGAKSFPSLDLTGSDGIKSADFVTKALASTGYTAGKQIIVYCGLGNQASLGLVALKNLGLTSVKIFQGGMTEVVRRCPENLE